MLYFHKSMKSSSFPLIVIWWSSVAQNRPLPKKRAPFFKRPPSFSGNKNISFSFSPPKKGREGQANKRSEGKDYAKINEKGAVEKGGGEFRFGKRRQGVALFKKLTNRPTRRQRSIPFLKGKIKAIHQEAGGGNVKFPRKIIGFFGIS